MPDSHLDEAIQSATQHHRAGRLDEAEAIYRQVLAERPTDANAMRLLGILSSQAGRHDSAVALVKRALELAPPSVATWHDLSEVLRLAGRYAESAEVLRGLVSSNPEAAEYHLELGKMERALERLPEAERSFREATRIAPENAEAHGLLGVTLADQHRLAEAIPCYHRALEIDPTSARAHNNLGMALLRLGDPARGEIHHRMATELEPMYFIARANLVSDLIHQQKLDEAESRLAEALQQWPDSPELHLAASWVQRLRGDLPRGWDEHEWRWKVPELSSRIDHLSRPRWDGQDLKGKTILLISEGGFGDSLQFARYAPLVADRGGRVLLHSQHALVGLLKTIAGVDQVISERDALPDFDTYCHMMTLPQVFQTTLANIPARIPYVTAPVESVQRWKQRLAADEQSAGEVRLKIRRIGLVWAGNPQYDFDRLRSVTLAMLEPLARLRGVRFYSLQKGPAAAELANAPAGLRVTDYSSELNDFSDTAALMKNLDLIVTVDSAAAHLAGALGRPAAVMLPFAPDWRWLLERKDSPWYPTLRLFRQKKAADWTDVVERIVRSVTAANQAPGTPSPNA